MKIEKLIDDLELNDKSIPYKILKKMITSNFSQSDENEFKEILSDEVVKVFTFINNKEVELISQSKSINKRSHDIKANLYNLTEYIKVNLLAIKRIIKRHDKFTGYNLMDGYHLQLKNKLEQLHKLNTLIKNLKNEKNGKLDSKYWIPSDCLVDIKLKLSENLTKQSSLQFNSQSNIGIQSNSNSFDKSDDSFVSTIYLDNTDFSIYNAFLEEQPTAFCIRIRWCGTKTNILTCELISADSTISIQLPNKNVLGFVNGDDVWPLIKGINNNKDNYSEIQERIKNYRLRPTIRTFFRRVTYSNEDVLINLDSNVVMIRECSNFDFTSDSFPLKSWVRNDVGYDWPFRNLSSNEIIRFPCSIIKVKQLSENRKSLQWLEDVLSNSRIEKVPAFTKYIHGCSKLYLNVGLEPNWIDKCKSINTVENKDYISRNSVSERLLSFPGDSDVSYNFTPVLDPKYKVAIPVRIEPKVFFANERTFLSWIQFAIFLGGIGTAMIGLGNEHAYLCGVMLISVSMIFSFYAFYLFYNRAVRIRVKDPSPYEDIIGPTILTGLFILAMLLSFIFKFPLKKNGLKAI